MNNLRKMVTLLILGISYADICLGYGVATHEFMSIEAIESSILDQLIISNRLNDIGVTNGTLDGIWLKNGLCGGDNQSHTWPIPTWIEKGAIDEDDWCGIPFVSALRFVNHFYNPINREGLSPPLIKGYSSLEWGLELTNDIPGQEFSYKDAKDYYYKGLTLPDPKMREQNLAKAFYALGHVIHLIQDLAQPQHTRDDAHPPWTSRTLYEEWTDRVFIPVNGYPPVYFDSPDKFWATGLGQGLAQFSHFNFVLQGTNFDTHRFFYPTFDYNNQKDFDIQDLCANTKGPPCILGLKGKMTFFGTVVEDKYTGIPEYNERASTFSVFSSDLEKNYGPGNELFTLNRFNFEEAHKFLIPRAVGYSAGLIDYFFRGSIDANLDANGNVIVKNSSSEDMKNGTFTLYYDDVNDVRKDVISKTGLTIGSGSNNTASLGHFTPPTSHPPKEPGKYILVFEGSMGKEDNAVVGKIIKLNSKLVVQKSGTGTGKVTSNPFGIQCDPDCQAEFDASRQVTLTATADQGFVFKEWSGDCSGTQDQTTVVMDGPKTCTAEFTASCALLNLIDFTFYFLPYYPLPYGYSFTVISPDVYTFLIDDIHHYVLPLPPPHRTLTSAYMTLTLPPVSEADIPGEAAISGSASISLDIPFVSSPTVFSGSGTGILHYDNDWFWGSILINSGGISLSVLIGGIRGVDATVDLIVTFIPPIPICPPLDWSQYPW